MFKKYDSLIQDSWRNDLKRGFLEAFRVLKPNGTLIFKWSETQIPTKQILDLTNEKQLLFCVWEKMTRHTE